VALELGFQGATRKVYNKDYYPISYVEKPDAQVGLVNTFLILRSKKSAALVVSFPQIAT
jgi:hypothetical protein